MVEYKETKSKEINKATYDLQHLNITGNVIPHNWFNTLRMENGAPDYQSIVLLSEIVYWYKPKDIFNEQGIQVGIGKKYDADTLQKSYEDLAEKFGMTKRQVREAVIRLENRGLVKRNFEYIKHKGMPLSNVLFIELFVDKLKEITIVLESVTPSSTESVIGVGSNSSEGYPRNRQTYTKSTTKNTTKIKDIKDNVTIVPSASKEKYEDEIKLVIDYYNKVMGKREATGFTSTNKKLITKVLKEGYTTRNCLDVINLKYKEWFGNYGHKNLVIATLFAFSNFEKYMDQLDLPPVKEQKKYQQPTQQVASIKQPSSFTPREPDENGFNGCNFEISWIGKRNIDHNLIIHYYKEHIKNTGTLLKSGGREITVEELIEEIEWDRKVKVSV